MTNHTFILTGGKWNIAGVYFDPKEQLLSVEGRFEISHRKDLWTAICYLTIGNNSSEIKRVYSFEPSSDIKKGVAFNVEYSSVGKMFGRMMVADENLISVYETEDKLYSGSEYMKKISNNYYKNKGLLFKETEKYSSWSFDLKRVKE